MTRCGAALAVAIVLLVAAGPANAAVFNVTNTSQLESAIGTSNLNVQGDTINLAAGTYTLTSALVIRGEDLALVGNAANTTIIRQTAPGRVIDVGNSNAVVELLDLTITGGNVSGGGGGVINRTGSGELRVIRSAIEGNRATTTLADQGGGGIYNAGGGLTVIDSSVSGNSVSITGATSGGGGIWSTTGASIDTSTLSGNSLSATGVPANSGGGAYYARNGGGTLAHVTIAGNSSSLPGAGIFNAAAATPVTLANSIVGETAPSGCEGSGANPFDAAGNNIDRGTSCDFGPADSAIDPKLGALANNGGPTRTRALAPDSPAINDGDFSVGQCSNPDQRGVDRSVGGSCDLGAFEFDGLVAATVPDCSPTGQIPLNMIASPNEGVEAFKYRVDSGPQQVVPAAGTQANTVIDIPEGRRTLEYWGDFTNGDELNHHTPQVLVDKTDPNVGIVSEQKRTIYVITRRASVDVTAADALSGLVANPSANGERIGTRTRGTRSITKTATDLCGNQQAATLDYRVLGPGLGVRAVLERVRGRARVGRPGSASAAQKGLRYAPLRQPREVPIRSLIDTRKGSIRLTSSRSRRATNIQDGVVSGGIFQVLQSRKRAAKGLTELRLKGSSFRRCRATGKGASAALSRRRIRRLRARARGRFRTRGRFSAATVRGTTFTVIDRCDGTLTKVTSGRVAVRDFRRKRTIIVKRGKSYLAKAPVRR